MARQRNYLHLQALIMEMSGVALIQHEVLDLDPGLRRDDDRVSFFIVLYGLVLNPPVNWQGLELYFTTWEGRLEGIRVEGYKMICMRSF